MSAHTGVYLQRTVRQAGALRLLSEVATTLYDQRVSPSGSHLGFRSCDQSLQACACLLAAAARPRRPLSVLSRNPTAEHTRGRAHGGWRLGRPSRNPATGARLSTCGCGRVSAHVLGFSPRHRLPRHHLTGGVGSQRDILLENGPPGQVRGHHPHRRRPLQHVRGLPASRPRHAGLPHGQDGLL